MKKIKKVVSLLPLLLLVSCNKNTGNQSNSTVSNSQVASSSANDPSKKDDVVVLYTNDVHCQVKSSTSNAGYANVASKKKELLKEYNNVVLVDAGDELQGDVFGSLTQGSAIVDIMNTAGYDFATMGNHEFDFGMEQFLNLAGKNTTYNQTASNIRAKYKYLSANFIDKNKNRVFDSYEIKTFGDKKVAFVGATTPDTYTSSTPAYFKDTNGNFIYTFSEGASRNDPSQFYKSIQDEVDKAKQNGADYVILLAHLGIDSVNSPYQSTDVIKNTNNIDVVLDGHSHSTIIGDKYQNKDGKNVTLSSTGTKLANLGKLTITNGEIKTELIKASDLTSEDSETKDVIDKYQNKFNDKLNEKLGTSDFDLTINDPDANVRRVRKAETNLANLVADAYENFDTSADFAVINGGSVRTTVKAGEIKYQDAISVSPFGNKLCTYQTTGKVILEMLEYSVSKLKTNSKGGITLSKDVNDEFGGFLIPSSKLKFEVDTSIEPGLNYDSNKNPTSLKTDANQRRVKNVKINNVAISESKTYKFVSNNYTIDSGGDGYYMFKTKGDNQNTTDVTPSSITTTIDNDVLANYIKKLCTNNGGKIPTKYSNLKGEGRITYPTK